MKHSPRRDQILRALGPHPLTARELSAKTDIAMTTINTLLAQYTTHGELVKIPASAGRWARWTLPPTAPAMPSAKRDPDAPPPSVRAW